MGLFDWFRSKPSIKLFVGQKVLARWRPEIFFYTGTIETIVGDEYLIQFDDGDQAIVTANEITPLDIKVGSRVFGRWQGGNGYFPGKVDRQRGNKIHIHYDDGDQEWTTISMVRVKRPLSAETSQGGKYRFHDNNTLATEPGLVRLSHERFRRLVPEPRRLPVELSNLFSNLEHFEEMLDEHMQCGDSRAACVIALEPLLVAAYTQDLDCVAVLQCPAWLVQEHRLQIGSRLLTVNTYGRGQRVAPDLEAGPNRSGPWTNFYPVIAEFVSDDLERITTRKAEIPEEEWSRCQQLGMARLRNPPKRWRSGSPFWSDRPTE